MQKVETNDVAPVWIRGPRLRARWGGMSNTAFYEKLKRGAIPKPHYPFGDNAPYWSMAEIEAFEAAANSAPGPRETPTAGGLARAKSGGLPPGWRKAGDGDFKRWPAE